MSTSPVRHLFQEELYAIPPKVAVVLPRSWENYSDDEKTLLAKILGSVKLSLAAVKIVSLTSSSEPALQKLDADRIIVFGSDSEFPPYASTQAQGFTVIKADDLSSLDEAKKKSLWVALRQMFNM